MKFVMNNSQRAMQHCISRIHKFALFFVCILFNSPSCIKLTNFFFMMAEEIKSKHPKITYADLYQVMIGD